MKFIEAGGAVFLAVSVAMHGEKHTEVGSYHGEPQPTRMLGEMVSTATAAAIPMFHDWDMTLRQFE